MGVLKLQTTLLKHKASKGCIENNIPNFEVLMIDFNALIHYNFQLAIDKINEMMHYIKGQRQFDKVQIDEYVNLVNTDEDLEMYAEYLEENYNIGINYDEIKKNIKNEEFIVNLLIKETVKYVDRMIATLNKGHLKMVYIAIDGIASAAKMREQKDRRYINAYMQHIKEGIDMKYGLNNDVEQINLAYYKTMICAGTKMMNRLYEELKTIKYDFDIEISGPNEKGEGEKKIMTKFNELNHYSSFCIMSPDSDMVILTSLNNNPKKMYLFRIDYQKHETFIFLDQNKFVDNLIDYYSKLIDVKIMRSHMTCGFFMLVIFGNDFLPKLEPFDISKNMDIVFSIAIKTTFKTDFIIDGKLNYKYILDFFEELNFHTDKIAIERLFNNKYSNYDNICRSLSITQSDFDQCHHHKDLKPITVDYRNLDNRIHIIKSCYNHFTDFIKHKWSRTDIETLYCDIHANIEDSYMLVVLPKICRFDSCMTTNNYEFFKSLVKHVINNHKIQLRIKLLPRRHESVKVKDNYFNEIQKLNKSQEPYRSMFNLKSIDLITLNDVMHDDRDNYYDKYIKINITGDEKINVIESYLAGIEFVFRYYIKNENEEWASWYYPWLQCPLIEDIISYIKNNDAESKINNIMNKLPQHNITAEEKYLFITPNDFTKQGISPNVSDIIPFIRGEGAYYCNKAKIDWMSYYL